MKLEKDGHSRRRDINSDNKTKVSRTRKDKRVNIMSVLHLKNLNKNDINICIVLENIGQLIIFSSFGITITIINNMK